MKAIIFADRRGNRLHPLTDDTCVALLPIAGKSLLEHNVESLLDAGIREAVVVVSESADQVEDSFGTGERWGMTLDWVLTRAAESDEEVIRRLLPRLGEETLIVRGDQLRSACIADFLQRALEHPRGNLRSTSGGMALGLDLMRAEDTFRELDLSSGFTGEHSVELDGVRLFPIDSLANYHEANLEAARGLILGLHLPAREVQPLFHVGPNASVALDRTSEDDAVFVGARSSIHPSASLERDVVISQDVLVDRQSALRATVVLPETYVGQGVELGRAIVAGSWLIQIDDGTVTRVEDRSLLASLTPNPLEQPLREWGDRLLGALLCLVCLPLAILFVVSCLAACPAQPWKRARLVGNRSRSALDGGLSEREFVSLVGACSVPWLKHLPRLVAVATGDLRLIGVAPLTVEEEVSLRHEWETLRRCAPVGLLGPAQILSPDSPPEERRLAEGLYARTRTAGADFHWLLRALASFFSIHSWSAPTVHSARSSAQR